MKTSNIILFSYIGLLALAFFVFTLYLSSYNKDGRRNQKQWLSKTYELADYKHIVLQNMRVNLDNGKNNSYSVLYHTDSLPPSPSHLISGDTLYLKANKQNTTITLYIPNKSVLNVISIGSKVRFDKLKTDTLFANAKSQGSFSGFNGCKIPYIEAKLSDSKFNAYSGEFTHLNIEMDHSEFLTNRHLKSVVGTAIKNSNVRLGAIQKINLDLDESSRLKCYP